MDRSVKVGQNASLTRDRPWELCEAGEHRRPADPLKDDARTGRLFNHSVHARNWKPELMESPGRPGFLFCNLLRESIMEELEDPVVLPGQNLCRASDSYARSLNGTPPEESGDSD